MTNPLQYRGWISKISLRGASGVLELVIALGLWAVTVRAAQAQTYTVLYNFTGGLDGGDPYAGVIRDAEGNLYGTTRDDGSSNFGTVFKVDTSGTETVLYSFTGGADGGEPYASLIRDRARNLYGTTYLGGASNQGTVFKLDTSGTETVLYSFAGGSKDGCNPSGGLLRDAVGSLFGTTSNCGASNQGTVFQLSKTGRETVLHSFAGGSLDGAYPAFASLLMDKVGNLYSVTFEGGASTLGVVYKLNKSRELVVLHSFTAGNDGCYPVGTPAMDEKGNIYGTASQCGASSGGIVWKVSKKGTETVLHSFAGGTTDGALPIAGVILDANGNFYGDTEEGGSFGIGTVYKLDKTGKLTVLHSFGTGKDGELPYANLTRDAKGNLYGTTLYGGSGPSSDSGVVFRLTP